MKKLYHHHKGWFVLVCGFAAAQLANNIRQDIALSPIYSYGMYSEIIQPRNLYTVTEVFVNNKQLRAGDFSPMQWDNITQPVEKFYTQQAWNEALWQTDISRLVPFAARAHFINTLTTTQFKTWYRGHLEKITGKTIDTVDTRFTNYKYSNNRFVKATN